MCIWKKEFIMQVEKRGSLSVLEAEPSSLFPWNVWKVWMVVSSSGWPLLTWWALLCVHMSEHSCLWIFFMHLHTHPDLFLQEACRVLQSSVLCMVESSTCVVQDRSLIVSDPEAQWTLSSVIYCKRPIPTLDLKKRKKKLDLIWLCSKTI